MEYSTIKKKKKNYRRQGYWKPVNKDFVEDFLNDI